MTFMAEKEFKVEPYRLGMTSPPFIKPRGDRRVIDHKRRKALIPKVKIVSSQKLLVSNQDSSS